MARILPRTSAVNPGRARLAARPRAGGLPRQWTCPDCGLMTRDETAIRLGYCSHCSDFTGMCGAGRKLLCPGVISSTTWHTPCTNLGTAAWQVMEGQSARVTLLCLGHDEQLRSGSAPWIKYAIPLDGDPRQVKRP